MSKPSGTGGGRAEAAIHAVLGGLLLLYIPWVWLLSGFGIGTGDAAGLFLGPMFIAAGLAVFPTVRLWRRRRHRVLVVLGVLAALAALGQVLVAWLHPTGCPPACRRMPFWVPLVFFLYHLAGGIGMMLPLIAGLELGSRALQGVGLVLFLASAVVLSLGTWPFEALGGGLAEWWVVLLALLGLLALCLIWQGVLGWLRAAGETS